MPKVQKATKISNVTLTPNENGEYFIEDEAQALLALQMAVTLTDEIDEIKMETGLDAKERDYEELRKALGKFQGNNELVEVTDGENKSLLIERTGSFWIWDEDQLEKVLPPDKADDSLRSSVIPLRTIIETKFAKSQKKINKVINQVTRRVVDPVSIDDARKQGLFTAEEIAPAFVQLITTKYVKIGRK